ncbi:serine/threonine-protein kinase [Streptomyces sp. NPDC058620]|uniref:serine/threonine-protein kinase n=1 Tax=Streptomyces sp. NPDC058620 TaxID=3346560 RepID=UPI00364B91EA
MRLGGVAEVAATLGVSTQRLAILRQRGSFPAAAADIAQGPIWDLDVIEAWASSGSRRSRPGRPSAAEARRLIGDRFEIEEPPIGRGGFADVYRALDRQTDQTVAVKIQRDVHDLGGDAVRRFQRELRILRNLSHPNVIPVIAHGNMSEQNDIWYAMPLAQGSLQNYIAEFEGDEMQIADVMSQICAGLTYVHDAGILHRDLKPANVLWTAEGQWAISDFGLAREQERVTTALTWTGEGFGTPLYWAPEQRNAAKTVDARADVFSLGKIMHHLLAGQPPFEYDDIPESSLRPVIQRATAKYAQRYESPHAFLEAIHAALSTSPEWQTAETIAKLLAPRLASDFPDLSAIDEFLSWAQQVHAEEYGEVASVLVVTPSETMSVAWERNSVGFTTIYENFCGYIEDTSFDFGYCDGLANTCHRAVTATSDLQILRHTVRALPNLGWHHSRWHVRDVLTGLLQGITSPDRALVALEALRDAASQAGPVEWSFEEFTIRSLHPVLRTGIRKIIESHQVGE